MDTQLKTWGNSQGVRLSREIISEAGFELDDKLDVVVTKGRIILQKPFHHRSLKERMEEYAGKLYSNTEIDYGEPVGDELW